MRLNKYLQTAGIGSRRKAEDLVAEGRVKIDGIVATATSVVEDNSVVLVDNVRVTPAEAPRPRLFLYHKPLDVLVTASDPQGRTTIYDVMPEGLPKNIVPVGRLDVNSEGLLLLTTDGRLAQYLMNPKSEIPRVYRVRVFGALKDEHIEKIRNGLTIQKVRYQGAKIELEKQTDEGKNRWYRITLHEGKNREVRKIFAHFRCTVNRLIRTSYGPFKLGTLPRGVAMEVPWHQLRPLINKMDLSETERAAFLEERQAVPTAATDKRPSKPPVKGGKAKAIR
jgi:23S rRNA pseudouridine2605 synthase